MAFEPHPEGHRVAWMLCVTNHRHDLQPELEIHTKPPPPHPPTSISKHNTICPDYMAWCTPPVKCIIHLFQGHT
jgi:hypothetical protein